MKISTAPFPSHCGSRILHNFGSHFEYYSKKDLKDSLDDGWYRTFFAIFVEEKEQKKEYDSLSKMFKILYQSPVLENPQTGNEYIIVIYLNEKP